MNNVDLHTINARAMAHDALFNIVFRNWGAPLNELMAHLDEARERLVATGLPQPVPEPALDAIREVMDMARAALQARLSDTH